MTQNTKLLALGLAGGYLLGRTKKAKFALAVASYVLGRRKGLNPQQLLTDGLKKLNETPEFAQLNEQLRGELMAAGRSVVTAAANRRLDSLSDALRDRTEALSGRDEDEDEEPDETGAEEPEEREEPEEGEAEPEDEGPEDEGPADEGPESEAPAEKAPAKKAPPKKAAAKKSAAGRPAAQKATAKKTTAKKSAAKKTAAKKSSSRSARRR